MGKQLTPRCRRCNRKLKDEKSIAQGMGETCKRKMLGTKIKKYLGPKQMELPFK